MFKHITMLNRMEKRYDVEPEVGATACSVLTMKNENIIVKFLI